MGKKSRQKKNRKNKKTKSQPSEIFQYGPLSIERHGKFILFSNKATTEQQSEILEKFKDVHKKILLELPVEVAALQSLIRMHDPVELMHRAAYMTLPLFLKYTSENEFSPEESYYLPTVEYIQYLITRTVPNTDGKAITEEEWDEVWKRATKVIAMTRDLLMSRKTLTDPPTEIDELRFFLDNRRLAIRVNRYSFFLQKYWKSSLTPYERQIQEIYGCGVDEIIKGLTEIEEYQKNWFLAKIPR